MAAMSEKGFNESKCPVDQCFFSVEVSRSPAGWTDFQQIEKTTSESGPFHSLLSWLLNDFIHMFLQEAGPQDVSEKGMTDQCHSSMG